MIIVRTIAELQKKVAETKQQGKTVGFVPTMGYLHEGHLSLVNEAKNHDDFIVMSIFVNPLQFGPNEDFDRYPRDFERDERLAKSAKVDAIFYPDVKEMYPRELSSTITVHKGVNALCGKSRPGHFDGVATVVLKLFNIVQPTRAYFGMKDAQQVAVIENMVADFNLSVQVMKCATLREEDGLAKSSRNVYLSDEERSEAVQIYASLRQAISQIEAGERNPVMIKDQINDLLHSKTTGIVDYVEVLAYPSLNVIELIQGEIIIAIALKFSKARLIDNITVTV
ncbi:pantoate--beta-alanine ligase [Anaerobacillus isosaccharinicus]|uniref:Pantothenate synthetase n=1 Tax=Anaerobacillus isosaccharinicus TaxID=1532552 RepID=A0A1S2KVS5_9BACI|nr:pantoate--beta-alanine ligase [Anaerobacillus isosaccharinicus]MBA5585890.1 pantoate--beta-alanine ligase [Anaerobacillus isosaccharinicus]QOY35820.1 pantoate--beta-alanine ligase [Anaerobacillus isosaccharinicus]